MRPEVTPHFASPNTGGSPGDARKLLILFYTRYFNLTLSDAIGFNPSVADDLCVVTTDRNSIDAADAIVFHVPNMDRSPLPAKRPRQLWVAMSMESDVNYPLQEDVDFMRQFDLRMNFRKHSDIQMLYFHPAHVADLRSTPRWKFRRAPAVYMASNDLARSNRYELVSELMKHMKVDSYGKSQNTRKIKHDLGRATKIRILSRYLFDFAFENAISPDYVSEKLFDGLVAGTVPVYLGAPNVDEYLPADRCIINVADYASATELSEYLLALAKNRKKYAEYLAWKTGPLRPSFMARIEAEKTPALRRLCRKISECIDGRHPSSTI
jgi:hypothetical protein